MSGFKKIVTVVGATGNQGAGIVSALLQNGSYHVRGLTRRPDGEAGKALTAKGVEVVAADLNDVESLKAAFKGSSIVFAVTDFFEPFGKSGAQEAIEVESQQGINEAKAAAATPTLQHFIWSTLPNGLGISGGKWLIPHFEGKNKVDAYIRSNKDLLAKTTFLWVTWYHSNYLYPMFTPYYIPTAGKYVQIASHASDTPMDYIGDVRANIGPFIEAILAKPDKTRQGAIVHAAIGSTTAQGLLEKWGKASGNNVAYVQTDVATYFSLWPKWAEEMGTMMQFWDEAREKSWSEEGATILTSKDLSIDPSKFVKIEESFKTLVL